jgi:hypothetical protein
MGGNFREGDQDEGSFGHARVGDFEIRLADGQVAEEQDVQIEGAGAVLETGSPLATELLLDAEQAVEEFAGGEGRFEFHDRVQEAGLGGKAHGLSGIEGGAASDLAEGIEAVCGGRESGFRRARRTGQVATHSDVGRWHLLQTIAGRSGVKGRGKTAGVR